MIISKPEWFKNYRGWDADIKTWQGALGDYVKNLNRIQIGKKH